MQVSPENDLETVIPIGAIGSDADYYIDYENGTIPLGNLPIGSRVVDPFWSWSFRLGVDYSNYDEEGNPTGPGEVKPVNWIVVAKDHYNGIGSHVTLLSEELIGMYSFDNSTHFGEWGFNHWGESGTHPTTNRGLRPWLNSTGIHAGEGFYNAFSESFKRNIITTNVPNREWEAGAAYITTDNVFIPSSTELGCTDHISETGPKKTYEIGTVFPYFYDADDSRRVAKLGEQNWWYRTRSPTTLVDRRAEITKAIGEAGDFGICSAHINKAGVRPVLNVRADVMVLEIKN